MASAVTCECHANAFAHPLLETKRAPFRLAIADDGAFGGYASLFDTRDSCGDIVAPGAFAASLAQRGASGVKMLWQHRPEEPIGVWTRIAEDARGLEVKGRLDLSVARAREALSLIRAGALDGLSIGFRTLRAASDRASGARRLIEIDLIEISIVTFPALPQARIGAAPPLPGAAPRLAAAELGHKLARLRMQMAALGFETRLRRSRLPA
jgi:HK97 family phage prohead protease